MADSESNYRFCEVAFEHFGTPNLVARLHGGGSDLGRFKELGVSVVDSASALVSLLDHYVRSPSAASLLLGQEAHRDVVEVVIGNKDLHGIALRDLRLPSDTLVLAIRRKGQLLLSHGYNRLRLGDEVTIVGSEESLEEVIIRFEGWPEDMR
jgi:Trk K+ transport system NAD-binding subunit